MPGDVFENLIPDPANTVPGRLVSVAQTAAGEPIVKITQIPAPPAEKDVLELSFIRKSPEYEFSNTMKNFLCYAHREGYKRVKLEDNALFANGTCQYNALFYRVLNERKPSLYVGFHFQPNAVAFPPARIESAKDTLYNSTITV